MIVSDALGQHIVPLIHDISQLDSIYVFCEKMSSDEQWAKEWSKVKGIFTQIIPICELLKRAARQCDQDSISVSFISVSDASNQNLNQLDQSFMYTQLLKEILFEIEYNEQSIKDLTVYCRDQYADNKRELNIIDKFERDYHLESPIWWYTYECFLYHMLNRALRAQEVDTIIKMGFFIRDLHRHIEQLHSEQLDDHQVRSFTVYRGQGLSKANFDKMMNTKGGLMSFNNFLSTSSQRDVCIDFADRALTNPDSVGILFKITIHPSVSSAPFALLNNVSSYEDSEQETLFSMHTTFRIGEIKQIEDDNRLGQVELTLTSDNDQQLNALTELLREETQGSTGWHRLGQLLVRIGEFDQAEEVYKTLLDSTSDNDPKNVAFISHQLGYIKIQKGDYSSALAFNQKTLEIKEKFLPPTHLEMAVTHNNIGLVHTYTGDYSSALSSFQKTLEIQEKSLPFNHSLLATTYGNIGAVHNSMGDYSNALLFLKKALEIQVKSLPSNHPSLVNTYNKRQA